MKKLILLTFFMLSTVNLASAIKCDINNYKDFIFSYSATTDLIKRTGSGCNLRGANLSGLNLSGALFIITNLKDSYIFQTNLKNAMIINSNLARTKGYQANFAGATIRSSNFKDSYLRQANFVGVQIRDSNFRDADLSYARLDETSMFIGSDIIGANLEGMTGWNYNNFRENKYSPDTLLPKHFDSIKLSGMIAYECWLFFGCSVVK